MQDYSQKDIFCTKGEIKLRAEIHQDKKRIDCLDDILNFYKENEKEGGFFDKKWIYKKYVTLAKDNLNEYDNEDIKNSLILMQNLFFAKVPDHYTNKGRSLETLNNNEKIECLQILEAEFLK